MFDQRRIAHIGTPSLSDGFANRSIERYHTELRETLKNRRGLGNDETAQRHCDALRLNLNYIRPHTGLPNNITPAEAAGIDLGLGENKIKDLIIKSSEGLAERKKENNLEFQLRKTLKYLEITLEKDCITVKAE